MLRRPDHDAPSRLANRAEPRSGPAHRSGAWCITDTFIDEADRLKTASLEQVRDHHDRTGIGVVLIGMPGIERRLARYPQLYSRIGFAHEYQPLSSDEVTFVLTRHWQALGMTISPDDFTDAEAIAAVTRITGGNFRRLSASAPRSAGSWRSTSSAPSPARSWRPRARPLIIGS